MNRDERIAEILASYFERGETPDAEKLRADHPELAGEIGDLLAALGHFDRAVRPADELPEGVPEQIGDYRILREIGRGGMGVVYEAEQVSMKRRVALKLLSLAVVGAPHAVKRFQREAQAAGRLHHTNIVPIHAMGQHAGHWYYAMELVEGLPLGEVIERLRSAGVRPTERALAHLTPGRAAPDTGTGAREYFVRVAEMFAGVAEALHLAHEEGIVHRDVKPSNLLLDADGTLKIVDFGLARMDAEGPSMTATGDLLGTPAYMSPEQAMAKRMKIDHRTDIYSLGATLYEVITLQPPFRGANLQDLCSQIITKDPALPRRIDQRVPRDLETIVLKAMEKDRDKRYRSAAELARDLRRFADGAAIAARRVGLVGRSWRRIRRHRVRSALAAAAILLAAGAAIFAVRAQREGELRRNAEYERLLLEAGAAFAGAGGDVQRNEFEPDMTTDASARETLAAATRLQPDRPEAYLLRIYTPGRTYDERLADIDAAHARGALTEASRRLLRAFLLRVRGDTEAAAEERMLAGAAEPKGAADWYAEARLLDADGRTDEALAHLDAVLGMKDASPAVAYIARRRRAQLRLDTGNAAGALEDMQQLIGMGDRGVGTRAQLAAAWLRLGREAEALDAFTSALRLARERNTAASWDELTRALFAFEAPAEWHDRATREELEARARDPDAHEDRALFLARFERFPEAIEHYGRAIELGGASPGNLHMNRGLAHLRIGEAEAALADFDRALELTDKATANSEITYFGEDGARRTYAVHAERLFSRSRALRDLKRWDEQLAALDEVLAREPDHARALADRGTVLANHGKRYADALADFERALELDGQTDGDKARVCLNKGIVLGKLGRLAEALEACRRAIELNPALGLSYAYAAQALESTGRVEEALAILTEGIANVPDATSLRQDRGALLQRVGRYEAALREFDDLLARDAGNPLTHCNRGIVLRYLERNDEALTAFERALALDPRREVATLCHLQRAAILDILGRLEESVESYERGLALDPNQPNFWANYALVLDGLGRPGAADAMGRAVALDPGDPRMRWQLAGFLLAEGKRDAAMEQYEAFLRTNPDDARKLVGLALQLAIPADASERERKVALACAQRATTILPSHPEPQRALGAALYRSGEWDQSVSAMERALKGAGDRADAIHHFFLAMALRRMDREDEARAAHRRGVAWLEQQSSAGAELRGLQEESQRLLGAASAEGDR